MSAELVRGLQERTARARPADLIKEAEGWWLCYAPGCPWWMGTVLPHGDGELARRVSEAEEFYARHGAVARFQISPGACAEGLDTLLAERGYHREFLLSLRVASTARVLEQVPAGSRGVRVDDRPAREWFDALEAVHGHHGEGAERAMLARVEQPSAYASVTIGAEVVAVGRAVADTGWAGLFGMATLPEARGKGAGSTVLAALSGWARTQGAERMYLQVEPDNAPAIRLYERAGFSELCGYHYRSPRSASV